MMRTLRVFSILLTLQLLALPGSAVTKKYNIAITVKGLNNQQAILAYYADDKKYIKDTLDFDENGMALISGELELPDGVYLLAFPSRNYEMFDMILKESTFSMSTDTSNMILNMQVKNSAENKALYEDLKFMVPLGRLNDSLRKVMKTEPKESEAYQQADKTLKDQAQHIKDHRVKLVENHPATFYASLVRIMQEPGLTKKLVNKDNTWKDTAAVFDYIRDHYFDIINFNDSGYVRSPVYKNFVQSYFDNYVVPIPDSMIVYIDKLIARSEVNKEQYQYILSTIFNQYANSPIMGYDAIMVHMAEKYFLSGKTWWSDAENLKKLKERVEAMKPTLIGQVAPNFIFQDSSLNNQTLYNILPKKRFTMLVFWNSDCGHCQHEIPLLKEKYEDSLRTFDFQVVDISTEQTDSTFRKFIRKNVSAAWTTGWDPYGQSAFRHDYDVINTPKIFIIDRKRFIMGKGVGVSDLYKFLEFYSRDPEQ